jgi:tetratricopeptide (TPR) repeat protein
MDRYADGGCKDNKLYKVADKEFRLAIKVKPNNSTAHCNYAKLYYLKKEYQKCIDEANIAVGLEPSIYSYNNLGNGWKGLGNFEKAREAYRQGYNIDKECGFIIRSLADLYYDHGDYVEAYIFYQQYENLFSNSFIHNRMKQILKEHPNL